MYGVKLWPHWEASQIKELYHSFLFSRLHLHLASRSRATQDVSHPQFAYWSGGVQLNTWTNSNFINYLYISIFMIVRFFFSLSLCHDLFLNQTKTSDFKNHKIHVARNMKIKKQNVRFVALFYLAFRHHASSILG